MKLKAIFNGAFRKQVPLSAQYSLSIAMFFLLALLGTLLKHAIGYKGVALMMLLFMALLALIFDVLPVLLAAVLSALTWNYFFIPPVYAFTLENREDLFLFLMFFLIALGNVGLSFQTKARNKKLREKEVKEKTISFYNTILNSLSHELRTPIATIIGAMDMLNDENGNLPDHHKRELMEEVNKAALRLNQQVENLLGLSRLDSGMVKLHLDWTDINELIHAVVQRFEQENQSHTFIFTPGENLPFFKLDTLIVEQVLVNLLQNAIKHTPEMSEIQISSHFVDGNCRIIFKDNGHGFPPEYIPT
ncbi:MAG TPA: DUF4118 domain-containing protein, partial [Saprospiraceae bacterium]|nr:DUF4118 domain-containing protein [Saprospiraceae bacterium]